MDSPTLHRAMRISYADGALATAMGTLNGGLFLAGFAQSLHASRSQFGVLLALPILANVAQLGGSYLIEVFGTRKTICLCAAALSRALWLPIVAIGWCGHVWQWSNCLWWISGLMLCSHVAAAIGSVAWLTWTRDLIPPDLRVCFWGKRDRTNAALSLGLSLLGGLFVYACQSRGVSGPAPFLVVFLLAFICGMLSLAMLALTPEPHGIAAPARASFRRLLAAPLSDRRFRPLFAFYGFWNLAMNLATPFFGVYMLDQLGLPFHVVTILTTASSLLGIAANGFWTTLMHRYGVRPVVALCTCCDAFVPLLWSFVSLDTLWLLPPIHLFGVFNAPIGLGPNNLALKLAPARNASPYLAMFSALIGCTSLAAVGGGFVAENVNGLGWGVAGLRVVFFISFLGRLACLPLLRHVSEPGAYATSDVVQLFERSLRRQFGALLRRPPPSTAAPARLDVETTTATLDPLPFPTAMAVDAQSATGDRLAA